MAAPGSSGQWAVGSGQNIILSILTIHVKNQAASGTTMPKNILDFSPAAQLLALPELLVSSLHQWQLGFHAFHGKKNSYAVGAQSFSANP